MLADFLSIFLRMCARSEDLMENDAVPRIGISLLSSGLACITSSFPIRAVYGENGIVQKILTVFLSCLSSCFCHNASCRSSHLSCSHTLESSCSQNPLLIKFFWKKASSACAKSIDEL